VNALRKQADPTGRLDVAAVRLVDELLRAYCPNLRDRVFDGGDTEGTIRLGAAKLLGPRVPRLRLVRKAVKTVAPVIAGAMKDARRLNR
jgi:hypothetical protein